MGMLINDRPVYAIVEYKFRDQNGVKYVIRASNVNSEMAIRDGIKVGSVIQIKYLPKDPIQN